MDKINHKETHANIADRIKRAGAAALLGHVEPAPLSGEVAEAIGNASRAARFGGKLHGEDADILLRHISDLTRRLAEAERRSNTWREQAHKNCRDMELIAKRREAAEARIADLETQLSGVGVRQYREAVERLHKAEARVRELEACLSHAVDIAEGKLAGTWDDLLQYRATLAATEAE